MDRQIRNIQKEYPEAVIIKEVYTGTKFQGRKELNKLIKQLKAGDTIMFDSPKNIVTIFVSNGRYYFVNGSLEPEEIAKE